MRSTQPSSIRASLAALSRDLSIQGAVIGALILRELHTRYGRDNIGYLWLIGEPLMLATVISTMHLFMGGHSEPGDISPGAFTLLGYTIFIIFRGIFNRAEGTLEGNLSLMHFKMITIFDIMLSRAIIETAGCASALIILMSLFIALGLADFPVRPLYLFGAVGLMAWFSFGLSLIITGWTFGSLTLGRLVHPVGYFMIPLSGAFWMMRWLPITFRDWMSWNPMVTIFEMARYGQFKSAPGDYIYLPYLIACNAFFTYVGLIAVARVKRRLHYT